MEDHYFNLNCKGAGAIGHSMLQSLPFNHGGKRLSDCPTQEFIFTTFHSSSGCLLLGGGVEQHQCCTEKKSTRYILTARGL